MARNSSVGVVVVGGCALVAVVGGLLVLQGGAIAPARPPLTTDAASERSAATGTRPPVDIAATATPAEAQHTQAPSLEVRKWSSDNAEAAGAPNAPNAADALISAAELLKHTQPKAIFTCTQTVTTAPTRRPDRAGRAPWMPRGATMARERLLLLCARPRETPLPVRVVFDAETRGAISWIGAGTTVVLQRLATEAAGLLVARYVRIAADQSHSGTSVVRADLPDLIGMWLDPPSAPVTVRCTSAGFAQVIADETPPAAIVDCQDRRGGLFAVRVDVGLRPLVALQIQAGSTLGVQVYGADEKQLLARISEPMAELTGGIAVPKGDLRRWLLPGVRGADASSMLCVSDGTPVPRIADPEELRPYNRSGLVLSDVATWVVCRQEDRPAVELELYFAAGSEVQLLKIGAGTAFSARVLAVADGRLATVFERAVGGALDAAAEKFPDLRTLIALGPRGTNAISAGQKANVASALFD